MPPPRSTSPLPDQSDSRGPPRSTGSAPVWVIHNRMVKAKVTIDPRGGQTKLRIRPSGVNLTLVMNTFGIARTVRGVLAGSPSLSAR